MSTKLNILSYISARWGDILTPKRLPVLDREVAYELVNNIYPTPIVDTHLTTNILTRINSNFTYNLTFTKIGRIVHVNGTITSISGSMSLEDIASITTSEFLPYSSYSFAFTTSISNSQCSFYISGDGISLVSSLGAGESVYFNASYPTLD